jgi:hypothetical protein
MAMHVRGRAARSIRRRLLGVLLAGLAPLLAPARCPAAITTFGSALSVPATKDTANDLNYRGSDIALPGSVFHIPHDGADTTLWNSRHRVASAPTSGQVVTVRLKGCAGQPSGAPAPLTQIHFQDLVPQRGGGTIVNVTTQAFHIPVCRRGGANGNTVTTYVPTNFCVARGDRVGFSDEGGFVPSNSGPPPYPSGVPDMVIGAVPGSTMDSFVRNNGVGNGATFSPSDTTFHDGFASNQGEELMLQATLATGPDATPLCSGGTRGVHRRGLGAAPALPIRISPQTDGVNRSAIVSVAIYCRLSSGCRGVVTMTAIGRHASRASYGHTSFRLPGKKTSHVPIRVSARVMQLVRTHRSGVPVTLTAAVGGKTVTQTIDLRIF